LKTRSSHFSFELHTGAKNHNKARVIATRTEDSHQSSDIPWIELIVIGVCAPTPPIQFERTPRHAAISISFTDASDDFSLMQQPKQNK
jgi:hypothetical protein